MVANPYCTHPIAPTSIDNASSMERTLVRDKLIVYCIGVTRVLCEMGI